MSKLCVQTIRCSIFKILVLTTFLLVNLLNDIDGKSRVVAPTDPVFPHR